MRLIENLWRRALCYFWHDRLTFQYERGYADGIREALANHEHYASLTPQELEAVLAQPASQQGY
jgi:hypothetical protein